MKNVKDIFNNIKNVTGNMLSNLKTTISDINKNLTKSQKKKLLGGLGCLFLAIILIGIGVSYSDPNSSYLSDQTVENLEFKNANLVYENGVSKYTVEVTNSLTTNYSLKTIDIIFKDSSGNEIENLVGYIGNTLTPGEMKLLDASVDKELTDIVTIEYVVNK